MPKRWKPSSKRVKKVIMIGKSGKPVEVYVSAGMSTQRYNALVRERKRIKTLLRKKGESNIARKKWGKIGAPRSAKRRAWLRKIRKKHTKRRKRRRR